jgi:hypothetical protein
VCRWWKVGMGALPTGSAPLGCADAPGGAASPAPAHASRAAPSASGPPGPAAAPAQVPVDFTLLAYIETIYTASDGAEHTTGENKTCVCVCVCVYVCVCVCEKG